MNEYCTNKSTVGHVTQKYVAIPLISAIPSPQISVSPLLRLRTAVPDHEQSLPSARHCNPSPTAVPPSGGGLQSQSLHPGPGLDHSHSPGLGLAVARALLQLGAHTDAVCSAGRRARDVAAEHEQVEVLEIFREHSVGADAPSDKDLVHLRLRPSARISCAAYGPTEAGRGGEPSARAGLVELSQVGVDGDYPGSPRG